MIVLIYSYSEATSQDYKNYLFPENTTIHESKQINCSNNYKYLKNHNNIQAAAYYKRPYNILSYDIYVDWFNTMMATGEQIQDRTWNGINIIKMVLDSANMTYIELDAEALVMDSIQENGMFLQTVPQPNSSNILQIPLNGNHSLGDTITMKIYYTYNNLTNVGFYSYPLESTSVARLAYTFCEPLDARAWLPCNDYPYDKAYVSTTIKVPLNYIAASNGLIIKADTTIDMSDSNGSYVVYHWKCQYPMATYLIAISVSKFKYFNDWYHKVSSPSDSIPVEYFVWDIDYNGANGNPNNAVSAFSRVPEMMKCFSQYYIEYPYEKYGMVPLEPFNMGGMEHQTITSINRSWLQGTESSGIAHELSHQWLGDLITCATFNDIWINEGGASWSESIWYEYKYGTPNGWQYMNYFAQNYIYGGGGLNLPPIYGLPITDAFNYYLTYAKSAWIYHMLRTMLGDTLYFNTLRGLLNTYKFNSLTTDQFRDYFKSQISNPPVSFDTYFDQWIYQAGHPVYNITTTATYAGSQNYEINLQLDQVQSGIKVPNVFVVPVQVLFYGDSGTYIYAKDFINNQRTQSWDFLLSFHPDSVKINNYILLCDTQNNTLITGVNELINNKPEYIKPSPNPANSSQNIYFDISLDKSGFVQADVFDELGQKVKSIYSGYLNEGNFRLTVEANSLQSGAYRILCTNGQQTFTGNFVVIE